MGSKAYITVTRLINNDGNNVNKDRIGFNYKKHREKLKKEPKISNTTALTGSLEDFINKVTNK